MILDTELMLRRRNVKDLKSQLSAPQPLFLHLTSKAKIVTKASIRVSHSIIKHKKPFQDGEMIKEAHCEASDSVFQDFKNKQKYYLQSKLSG